MRHYRLVMVLSTQLTILKFKLVSLGNDAKKTAAIQITAVFVI